MKIFLPVLVLILLMLTGTTITYMHYQFFTKSIINDKSISWSNEWQTKVVQKQVIKQTVFSGSEINFDFKKVNQFLIKGTTTNMDNNTSITIYLDKTRTSISVKDIEKGFKINAFSDTKLHSFRLIFYCQGWFNPCNFTLTNFSIKGGEIFSPRQKLKSIGVLGDSISLLYAQDNYSSILSRNISYHLHNASIWGRDLSHYGKKAPAVILIGKDLLSYKPNIILISLGTNDILDSVKEDDFILDFKNILLKITNTEPHVKVVILSILPGKTHQLEEITNRWNIDIQKILPSTIFYVDATNLLNQNDYLDAIHPNTDGQKKLASFLTKYLVTHKLL